MRTVDVCVILALLGPPLAACQTFYFHDDALEQSTAKADAALTGVSALKPFDDQLDNLQQFAPREDLAVADYWTSVRDKQLVGMIAPDGQLRQQMLADAAWKRLETLTGLASGDAGIEPLFTLAGARWLALEHQHSFERRAQSLARQYLTEWEAWRAGLSARDAKKQEAPDLACDKLLAYPQAELDRLAGLVTDHDLIQGMGGECQGAAGAKAEADQVTQDLKKFGGEIGSVAAEADQAEKQTRDSPGDRSGLAEVIKKAGEYQSSADGLEQLRKDAETALENAGDATKLAGWQELDDQLSKLLKITICTAPDKAVKAETKTEAKCDSIAPASGSGRALAAWGVLKALAQLQDANTPQRRSANWLTAAKAIVAAEKADAKLSADAASAKAASSRQRLEALVEEGRDLGASLRWLNPRGAGSRESSDCVAGLNVLDRRAKTACAYAAYVMAWNKGRLPAEVLRYRPIQIDRETAVRRSRAVAEKQYALATAGSATLKAYGPGGVSAQLLAQTAFDVATVAIASGGGL